MDVHYPTASLPAPLRSELEYEPYVAVLVSIDSDGPQSDSFTAIQGSIEKRLAPLRDLEQRCTAYREDNIVDGTNPKYSHLYKVMDFLPMGHSNTLGFVLLDDFDPVHWITSSCDTTIEEVSLGFCPDIKQLLPTLKGKRPSWTDQCFTSPKGLFESYSSNGNDNIPLLLFTSFKIGGLASLEHGLQSYQAIIKSILSELTRGLRLMEANLESFTEWEVALDDIKMMRICILDLQGQEEIGILFLCNNYTIPMTLVSMLQYLTMAQVFSQAPELEKEWTDTGKKPNFWTAIRKVGKIAGKERIGWDDNKWNERLDSTHVFRWTRSVVAINPSEFYENSCTHVKGHLDYLTELRVPAGHQSGYRDLSC